MRKEMAMVGLCVFQCKYTYLLGGIVTKLFGVFKEWVKTDNIIDINRVICGAWSNKVVEPKINH